MTNSETLKDLRISAESHGVFLPREKSLETQKKVSIKNQLQPIKKDRKSESFLNHSNGINSRLDSYDNERLKIIGFISRKLARNEQPKIEHIFRIVELSIMTETALSQYDSIKFKENKIFSKARENFSLWVTRYIRIHG